MRRILTQGFPSRLLTALCPRGGFGPITVLLAGLVLAGCAGSPGDPSARVTLERADREGFWRATYHMDEATSFLRFQRPAAFYRETVWEVMTPGWSLERSGDLQILTADPEAATRLVVVEFPVHTRHIRKEYELFGEFSDGSLALYSGHFYVTTDGPEVEEDEADFLRRLELVPAEEERMVVQGEVFETRRVWDDPHGDGTYIYFGTIDPVETPDMIGIIDPGAPSWIVETLDTALPEMFSLYSARFGEPLPWKPVVLFSFEKEDSPGLSSGGGTLTGLVQMSTRGKGWNRKTMESVEQLLSLIAHEAAHFWNGQLHSYEDITDSWMHEGSADAFASILLRGQGAIDDERLARRWTAALNKCANGLEAGSLSTSMEREDFGNYYSCGEIIAIWSVASLPGERNYTRLFDIWRAVFERIDPVSGKHDRGTYFAALGSLGVDEASIRLLGEFVDTMHPEPSAVLVDLMSAAGITINQPEGLSLRFPVEQIGWVATDSARGARP